MKADIFNNIQKSITRAGETLSLDDASIKKITEPYNVMHEEVSVSGIDTPLAMYRVQFNNALGPYKGGIRFHPDVDLEEVKSLAVAMMLKCSLVGIPMGGAKGGVACNPRDYDDATVKEIARAWARTMKDIIGVDKDIPAPDVNTNAQTMATILDEYESIHGRSEPGMITGKPIVLGGSLGREAATSQGGVYVLDRILKHRKEDRLGKRVVIQGFGNVGSHAARILAEEGYIIVGVSDRSGAVYAASGLDIQALFAKDKEVTIKEFFSGDDTVEHMTNEELLVSDCDILIPAALEYQITEANADCIQASIILELANNPTSASADTILNAKGIVVIPDILANAGGVTVSYFEWVQNRMHYYWSLEEVNEKLSTIITDATDRVYERAEADTSSLREAAILLAVDRVGKAVNLRS